MVRLRVRHAAAALLLLVGLTGCVDVEVHIALTGPTTARATTVQTMNADLYTLVAMNRARPTDDPRRQVDFCSDQVLVETVDGGATCTLVEGGDFARLTLGHDAPLLTFTPAGPNLVRIALPLAALRAQFVLPVDAQRRAVETAMVGRHALTLRFAGLAVLDTNMALTADGKAAEQVIRLTDLLDASSALPSEYFAIVRSPP